MIVRYEAWGAWVKVDAGLVALSHEGARALGLEESALWTDPSPPPSKALEVHVAVTSRCAAGCEGCYLDARPDGFEPPRAEIEVRLRSLAESGVFTVAFGGGEPTLREDLGELADFARGVGLTPVVTTSGLGLGERKLAQLTHFSQVNVSYDGLAEDYVAVRGFDGSVAAESAITKLSAAGVTVGVNVVLTRATFARTLATLAHAHALGANEAQLLRYKPAGRAKSLDYLARRLSPGQTEAFPALLREIAKALPTMRIRIDCALVPFLSADPDLAARPEDLARWGVFGCEAGASLAAMRVDGVTLPCSFAEPSELEPILDYVAAPSEPCASCTLRPVCRGGCKVVSRYLNDRIGPDPECPRVRRLCA